MDHYQGYAVFQPIVNGIGGNLVCVQSSRLATKLHQTAIPGVLPENTRILEWPWRTLFFGSEFLSLFILYFYNYYFSESPKKYILNLWAVDLKGSISVQPSNSFHLQDLGGPVRKTNSLVVEVPSFHSHPIFPSSFISLHTTFATSRL